MSTYNTALLCYDVQSYLSPTPQVVDKNILLATWDVNYWGELVITELDHGFTLHVQLPKNADIRDCKDLCADRILQQREGYFYEVV